MSRELEMSVSMQGTSEELLAMLKVLVNYETKLRDTYWDNIRNNQADLNDDCGYLENVRTADGIELKDLTDNELQKLAESRNKISISADGPFGTFAEPGDICFFEDLAEAAPNAAFSGRIIGVAWGEDIAHCASLSAGELALNDYYGDEVESLLDDLSAPMTSSIVQQDEFAWHVGDHVIHAAFGKGSILQVLPVGNDTMLKIAFDDLGSKMLMAGTQTAYLKKL